ncbi:MAG TPA: nuclear transport factor 2 family protein [Methylomirabilota bacterium]|nr:nuclear transport factor 2 family protein [Methylomirabilota bacterium]
MEPTESEGLVEANARFYRVFESQDLERMDAIWSHGDHVRCVHPGWCLLAGWEAIRGSWETIFKNSTEMRFSLGDVHAHVEGGLGWVTCTENILSEARGNISVTSVLATNIFERHGAEWLMVHHHASHILTGDPAAQS